jgi:hypothetical protein
MTRRLSKLEKAQAKVVFATTVLGHAIQHVDIELGADATKQSTNPAVQQCMELISDILDSKDPERRTAMVDRVMLMQKRLTKKVRKLDKGSVLIGFMQFFVSGTIKHKVGTRLDFIIETFKTHLPLIEEHTPHSRSNIGKAAHEIKKHVIEL